VDVAVVSCVRSTKATKEKKKKKHKESSFAWVFRVSLVSSFSLFFSLLYGDCVGAGVNRSDRTRYDDSPTLASICIKSNYHHHDERK
jgi:hypothetical protein